MLIVKREERDEVIAETNISLEHVGPPGDHLIEAGRTGTTWANLIGLGISSP